MRPWCVGLEAGAASGWPATDWIEDFVLRQSGPEVYDAWTEGEHAWTSPEIRAAFEAYGEVVAPERTFGGRDYVVNTNFGAAANPMFDDDPGCVFHHQASFITEFFENEGGAGDGDYDFFRMPDINPQYSGAMTGAGDLFGMFNDTPEARALMEYLVTAEAQSIWVGIGGAISGNTTAGQLPGRDLGAVGGDARRGGGVPVRCIRPDAGSDEQRVLVGGVGVHPGARQPRRDPHPAGRGPVDRVPGRVVAAGSGGPGVPGILRTARGRGPLTWTTS